MLKLWLCIFALTYLLELPLYLGLLRSAIRPRWGLLLCLVLNLTTHPVVWFVLPSVLENQVHYVLVGEAFAVVVEGLVLIGVARLRRWEGWPWLSLVGVSFLANAFSASVGEIAGYRLIQWLGIIAT